MEVTPVCISVSVYKHLSEFVNYMIQPLPVVTVVHFCSTSLRLQTTWTTNIGVAQLVLFLSSYATHFVPTDCQTWTKCEGTFLHIASWCANQRCCGQLSPASPSGSSNLYMKMDRQRRWNGTDSRQPKYWEENLLTGDNRSTGKKTCHSAIMYTSNVMRTGTETGPSQWESEVYIYSTVETNSFLTAQ